MFGTGLNCLVEFILGSISWNQAKQHKPACILGGSLRSSCKEDVSKTSKKPPGLLKKLLNWSSRDRARFLPQSTGVGVSGAELRPERSCDAGISKDGALDLVDPDGRVKDGLGGLRVNKLGRRKEIETSHPGAKQGKPLGLTTPDCAFKDRRRGRSRECPKQALRLCGRRSGDFLG